ncbi:hypothetical protein JE261_004541 [Salmonella enterica subsp. enterica serovar Mbandaka]|nr:hypothetical protein [Salmonella enterica subsp. enterica serovar Mbandaka]
MLIGILAALVFPAPAGINRVYRSESGARYCVPRASGDKPALTMIAVRVGMCSPRQRG